MFTQIFQLYAPLVQCEDSRAVFTMTMSQIMQHCWSPCTMGNHQIVGTYYAKKWWRKYLHWDNNLGSISNVTKISFWPVNKASRSWNEFTLFIASLKPCIAWHKIFLLTLTCDNNLCYLCKYVFLSVMPSGFAIHTCSPWVKHYMVYLPPYYM